MLWLWPAQAPPLQACSEMAKIPAETNLVEKLELPPLDGEPPEADHE